MTTPAEIMARVASARRALARCMERRDAKEREREIETLLDEICALQRLLLVGEFEAHVSVATTLKPVFEWMIWRRELETALSICPMPAPGAVASYEEIIAEIDLRVQLSNSTVDIDGLNQERQRDET